MNPKRAFIVSDRKHDPLWRQLSIPGFEFIGPFCDPVAANQNPGADLTVRWFSEIPKTDLVIAYAGTNDYLLDCVLVIGAALTLDRPLLLVGGWYALTEEHPIILQALAEGRAFKAASVKDGIRAWLAHQRQPHC